MAADEVWVTKSDRPNSNDLTWVVVRVSTKHRRQTKEEARNPSRLVWTEGTMGFKLLKLAVVSAILTQVRSQASPLPVALPTPITSGFTQKDLDSCMYGLLQRILSY